MTTRRDQVHDLARAVRAVRFTVAESEYPLPVPSAPAARARAAALLEQVDDYLLPRLTNPRTPLLVVVGGSTGAGKSTLVNSLVRAPVSAAGVLRPTTRTPVLICHPSDAPWFRGSQLLSVPIGANGGAGTAGTAEAGRGPGAAGRSAPQLLTAPALSPGIAFVDAPDIDSVVAANRALAHRLFAAADLWLFVTTANRYADAVPWQLLQTARDRGAVVAVVLARVAPAAIDEVVGLLTGLLHEHWLAEVPIFVLPETRVDRQGLLPETATGPLRSWFEKLAGDETTRTSVIRYTLDGALAALPPQLAGLAAAADEQVVAADALAEQVGLAYGLARGTVERGLRSGVLAPAEPTAVPASRLASQALATQAMAGQARERLVGRPAARHRQTAGEAGLVQLVLSAAADAAEQVDIAWRSHPVGAALLAAETAAPSPELPWRVQRVARERPEEELPERLGELLDDEAARWLDRLAGVPPDNGAARRLREVAAELERARSAAGLTASPPAATGSPPEAGAAPAAGAPGAELAGFAGGAAGEAGPERVSTEGGR